MTDKLMNDELPTMASVQYIPSPIFVATEEERRLVQQFLCLLRACRENAMITMLKEKTGFRWWANGQPAGILRI